MQSKNVALFFYLVVYTFDFLPHYVIKYCETAYERNGKSINCYIKNSGEILNAFKSKGFLASSLSTYDFSTLYTALPHNLIKEKLTELMEQGLIIFGL